MLNELFQLFLLQSKNFEEEMEKMTNIQSLHEKFNHIQNFVSTLKRTGLPIPQIQIPQNSRIHIVQKKSIKNKNSVSTTSATGKLNQQTHNKNIHSQKSDMEKFYSDKQSTKNGHSEKLLKSKKCLKSSGNQELDLYTFFASKSFSKINQSSSTKVEFSSERLNEKLSKSQSEKQSMEKLLFSSNFSEKIREKDNYRASLSKHQDNPRMKFEFAPISEVKNENESGSSCLDLQNQSNSNRFFSQNQNLVLKCNDKEVPVWAQNLEEIRLICENQKKENFGCKVFGDLPKNLKVNINEMFGEDVVLDRRDDSEEWNDSPESNFDSEKFSFLTK